MSASPRLLFLLVVLVFGLAACRQAPEHPDFEARVGNRYLTREELAEALAILPARQDSAEARQQVIEQWLTNELLYQEALRRGLRQDPAVERLLAESERSVLVSTLIARLFDAQTPEPTEAELLAYFERHKEQLRLLEPFVHVRHLTARTPSQAEAVQRLLRRATPEAVDTLWTRLTSQYATDPEGARSLSSNYFPESRLFTAQPALRAALSELRPGELAPVLAVDSLYHVLQLVARVPEGTIPEPAWIQDELQRRLMIQTRKQIYARQVQRLRNEALAREALEVR